MTLISRLLLVAIGGALGAAARYGVGLFMVRTWGAGLPLGTWVVNLLGSFLLGLAVPLFAGTGSVATSARFVLAIGFLGSFTTFSTFSLETVALWQGGQTGWALVNAGGSVVFGIAGVVLGLWIGRMWA